MLLCLDIGAAASDCRKLQDAELRRVISGKIVSDDVHYKDFFYEGVFMNKHTIGA